MSAQGVETRRGTRAAAPAVMPGVEECVEALIERLGTDLRVGLPLGLGKPAELVNALYGRAKADAGIQLRLLTALSLEKPAPSSKLESAFLGPFLDRVFEGVVELDYVRDQSAGRLPQNVRVLEFFFRPGSRLGNAAAQRDYISTNYTFAARDVYAQGCNVVMQSIARRETPGGTRYSLSCNPDTGLELVALLRAAQSRGERRIAVVGVVNQTLPYMAHDAEVDPGFFDLIVDHPRYSSALFSTPKTPVAIPDHAIGLLASALVRDGGTLQIGIGALGDAIVHALELRQTRNSEYQALLDATGTLANQGSLVEDIGGVKPFEKGLYGATEMFVDGFWHLLKAGILRREVYDFWALQELVNRGVCDPRALNPAVLDALADLGVDVIRENDFRILHRHGFFTARTRYDRGCLVAPDGTRLIANLGDPLTRKVIGALCLGESLRNGFVLHAGFFLGPRAFYDGLRAMSQEERDRIGMTGVDRVNQLDHNPRLYRAQRIHARFINTGMMATLSGAVVSDGLADGRVVSGVGGQYNFVAMAHQLATGRSILMVRATRQPEDGGAATSNIVFNYAHTTIPRHLRDLLLTEYGIADLRGQTDSEVAKRLINVADTRFQPQLLAQAQAAGKIEPGYMIPEGHRRNTPEALEQRLRAEAGQDLLPALPFGSDFTPEELRLAEALRQVKSRGASTPRWRLALGALLDAPRPDARELALLTRMGLQDPRTLQDRVVRKLLLEALRD